MQPVAPLECHPWYRDKAWLLDWLNEHASHHVVVPTEDDAPTPDATNRVVITRHKAWGLAPHVGRPFVYVWWVGIDNLGRQVAGESRMVYIDPFA